MEGEEILLEHVDMVDSEIERCIGQRRFPSQLYNMMKYHLGWVDEKFKETKRYRGKRFRPTLCLLSYKAISGVYDKALPAAAAIELIHNFSLIHDDIEDMDEQRRHRPTVWKLWGIPHAINVGDGMHVLANLCALRLREVNVTDAKIVDVLEILNKTVMELCEGQFLDMEYEKRIDITINMYLKMISKKTAALIEASTHIGAILATENRKIIEKFRLFGHNIGMAFQIIDDIIGIWGKEEKTGKPKASDIRNKKKTLPIIYAMEKTKKKDKKFLTNVYKRSKKISEEDISRILEILEKYGAREFSINIAKEYEKKALENLNKTGLENSSIEKLKKITEFITSRKY